MPPMTSMFALFKNSAMSAQARIVYDAANARMFGEQRQSAEEFERARAITRGSDTIGVVLYRAARLL